MKSSFPTRPRPLAAFARDCRAKITGPLVDSAIGMSSEDLGVNTRADCNVTSRVYKPAPAAESVFQRTKGALVTMPFMPMGAPAGGEIQIALTLGSRGGGTKSSRTITSDFAVA